MWRVEQICKSFIIFLRIYKYGQTTHQQESFSRPKLTSKLLRPFMVTIIFYIYKYIKQVKTAD